jgi:3alpha(or 20beta)-hydroxysteroid dehydrogenase
MFDLAGKLAVVTGGKNGNLGPIWCESLQGAGAKVVVLDRPDYDISKQLQVNDFRDRTLQIHGVPDILVNNAAIDTPPTQQGTFFGGFDDIIRVNLSGAVKVTEVFLPEMIKKGRGTIVNIGSIQGYGGADYRNYTGDFEKPFGYNASKWGLRGLAKSLTVQYGRYGIRSVTISFGPYDGGKLTQEFLGKFLHNVPLGRTVSKESLQMTLLYACCCPELAGVDWRIDAGLGAWA